MQPRQTDITDQRTTFILAALDYLGTPYRHRGMVKGAGVDCLTLIVCAGQAAGVLGHIDLPPYGREFNLHRGDETYLDGLLGFTHEVELPKPGDIALWRFGRCFSHAAIVVEWPMVVHAHVEHGVVLESAVASRWLSQIGAGEDASKPRPLKFLTYWNE